MQTQGQVTGTTWENQRRSKRVFMKSLLSLWIIGDELQYPSSVLRLNSILQHSKSVFSCGSHAHNYSLEQTTEEKCLNISL